MCVAAFAFRAHPHWRLVAIGNRDEYHDRPAAPLTRWSEPEGIIAGRDLRSGGTWLGASNNGRFGLVTNLRGFGEPTPGRASRGSLVTDWLAGSGRYADPGRAELQDFNPFNLILADSKKAQFLSNRPGNIRTALTSGIYGLSNARLDEPWPKTLQLKAVLLNWLTEDNSDLEPLFAALRDESLPDIGLRPREPSEIRREAPETPVFIRDPVYGTRCSTVAAVNHEGVGVIAERTFSAEGIANGETRIDFAWT